MRLYMPALIAVAAAVVAVAQDRTVTVRARDVEPTEARVVFEPDGGCQFVATVAAVDSDGVRQVATSTPVAFNGGRCGTLALAATQVGRLALRVGDGGKP